MLRILRRHHRDTGTEQQISDDIRYGVDNVFRHINDLRRIGWPWVDFERRAFEAALETRVNLTLTPTTTLPELLQAIEPLITAWWPERLTLTRAMHEAVEELRRTEAVARRYLHDT